MIENNDFSTGKKFKSLTKGNDLWWYGGGEVAWQNKQKAFDNIPEIKRKGLTIGIWENTKIVEYIWHDLVTNENLTLKNETVSSIELSSSLTSDSEIDAATSKAVKLLKDKLDDLSSEAENVDTKVNTNSENISLLETVFNILENEKLFKGTFEGSASDLKDLIDNLTINQIANLKDKLDDLTSEAENVDTKVNDLQNTKLSKGNYEGTGQNLKEDIDSKKINVADKDGIVQYSVNLQTESLKFEDVIFNGAEKTIQNKSYKTTLTVTDNWVKLKKTHHEKILLVNRETDSHLVIDPAEHNEIAVGTKIYFMQVGAGTVSVFVDNELSLNILKQNNINDETSQNEIRSLTKINNDTYVISGSPETTPKVTFGGASVPDGTLQWFNVGFDYIANTSLKVYKNGLLMFKGDDYAEFPPNSVNFTVAPLAGDKLIFDK